jgi:hypothetical protein
MRKRLIIASLLVLLALAVAVLFSGFVSMPSVMDIYGCTEMFSRYHVDAAVAQQHVPSKWQVKTDDEGRALLLVMVQRCEKMVLDGIIDVGAVGMSHLWIEIGGPDEIVTSLPGTTMSLPTRYWHILPHQLDSRLAHLLFRLVGVDAQLVEGISFDGDAAGTRTGAVFETDAHQASYQWTESSALYPAPDVVTGSQHFYRRYTVRESEAIAKCESHFLGDSQVALEVSPDSALGRLGLGDTLHGWSNPVWVANCHVNYRVRLFPRD